MLALALDPQASPNASPRGTDMASTDYATTGAIRMARLAKEKAGHDEVKKLAGNIIAGQQRAIPVAGPEPVVTSAGSELGLLGRGCAHRPLGPRSSRLPR
jgi:hypothetical protein